MTRRNTIVFHHMHTHPDPGQLYEYIGHTNIWFVIKPATRTAKSQSQPLQQPYFQDLTLVLCPLDAISRNPFHVMHKETLMNCTRCLSDLFAVLWEDLLRKKSETKQIYYVMRKTSEEKFSELWDRYSKRYLFFLSQWYLFFFQLDSYFPSVFLTVNIHDWSLLYWLRYFFRIVCLLENIKNFLENSFLRILRENHHVI